MTSAIYPASFDPIHYGHIDIARRAARLFDEVVIAVSDNSAKNPLFTVAERVDMLRAMFADNPKIRVSSFSTLLIEFVRKEEAVAIVRGLRAISDFEYELQMASMNSMLDETIETMFFMASTDTDYFREFVFGSSFLDTYDIPVERIEMHVDDRDVRRR